MANDPYNDPGRIARQQAQNAQDTARRMSENAQRMSENARKLAEQASARASEAHRGFLRQTKEANDRMQQVRRAAKNSGTPPGLPSETKRGGFFRLVVTLAVLAAFLFFVSKMLGWVR